MNPDTRAMFQIEWTFLPADYFGISCTLPVPNSRGIEISTGKARAEFVSDDLSYRTTYEQHHSALRAALRLTQAIKHTPYELIGPRVTKILSDGSKHALLEGKALINLSASAVLVLCKVGGAAHNSEVSKEIAQSADLACRAALHSHNRFVQAALESYESALKSPNHELVHLYEIREILKGRFAGERAAMDALKISRTQWDRLGTLCCSTPLLESRHRGLWPGELRRATRKEIGEARTIARKMITQFLVYLGQP